MRVTGKGGILRQGFDTVSREARRTVNLAAQYEFPVPRKIIGAGEHQDDVAGKDTRRRIRPTKNMWDRPLGHAPQSPKVRALSSRHLSRTWCCACSCRESLISSRCSCWTEMPARPAPMVFRGPVDALC